MEARSNMKFDSQMALAELDKLRILVAHHLRQMRLARDLSTAKTFATLLGKTASDANYAVREIKKVKKPLD